MRNLATDEGWTTAEGAPTRPRRSADQRAPLSIPALRRGHGRRLRERPDQGGLPAHPARNTCSLARHDRAMGAVWPAQQPPPPSPPPPPQSAPPAKAPPARNATSAPE